MLPNLEEILPDEEMSPYKAAKLVSKALGYNIPPQMLYNYIRNPNIKLSASRNSTGKLVLTREAVLTWFAGYVARKAEKATSKQLKEPSAACKYFQKGLRDENLHIHVLPGTLLVCHNKKGKVMLALHLTPFGQFVSYIETWTQWVADVSIWNFVH